MDYIMPGSTKSLPIYSQPIKSTPQGGTYRRKYRTKNMKMRRSKSRRFRGGKGQYLSNVGYSSGYSLPFFTKTLTNII
jgi:hypothetical protein